MNRISILQPLIPHYRKAFFEGIDRFYNCEYYCYEDRKKIAKSTFRQSDLKVKSVKSFSLGPFLVYNPLALLGGNVRVLILMLHVGHITTWLLLLTKFIHKKNIVLWGHGISVKRYAKESEKPSTLIKWQIKLADLAWLYTQKEKDSWNSHIKNAEKLVALNNTLSGIENIVDFKPYTAKDELKKRYYIKETKICIFSARFTLEERRADLLERVIQSCKDIGFIIIGDGPFKPDFSAHYNVYDMGAIYDTTIKNELFSISDIYLQPAWLGLSLVEAMAYGLPVFTLKRTEEIKQCVEYYYLEESKGGKIFEDVESLINGLQQVGKIELDALSVISKQYVKNNLMMKHMVNNAVESLKSLDR